MKNVVISFKESFDIMRKDKLILLFSFVPVFIGLMLYYFLGQLIFTDLLGWINGFVETSVGEGGVGKAISWLITIALSVLMYFAVSWTFVLIVSLIASPFNDIISNRTEQTLQGKVPEPLDNSIKRLLNRLGLTLVNELKKITFIILMTIIALAINFVPILVPLSFLMTALLFAVSFADYSWSRNDLLFKDCLRDIRKNFLGYATSGALFIFVIAIPIINLMVLPFAVVYYTVFYTKNNLTDPNSY